MLIGTCNPILHPIRGFRYRAARITELLQARRNHTVETMKAIQLDYKSNFVVDMNRSVDFSLSGGKAPVLHAYRPVAPRSGYIHLKGRSFTADPGSHAIPGDPTLSSPHDQTNRTLEFICADHSVQ